MNTEIIMGIIAAIILVVLLIYLKGFKNWLVWAVSEAEKVLGSKTGELKLRYAYNLAVKQFPIFAKILPFTIFSKLVDSALKVMNYMIENNASIAEAITNTANNEELSE